MKNILHILILLTLLSCSSENTNSNNNPKRLKIVTTTGMLYDAVLNIAKDCVDASALMGPGVDPHLYKATQGDLAKLKTADLVVYNGLFLEGKMGEILKKFSLRKPVLAAAEVLKKEQLRTAKEFKHSFDPHVWFSIILWKEVVSNISSRLQESDSTNADYYKKNTLKYLSSLDTLHSYVKQRVEEIPQQQRMLITAHDAFGYFGREYKIRVKGLQGISTVSDFGLRDITDITELIIKNKIKAVFIETSVSEKSIKAVLQGCKEQGHDVIIGGSLYSDAMGEFGTFEGTYIGMVKSNVDKIVEGLK